MYYDQAWERTMIKHTELENAIESLPSAARKELMDFLAYLQQKYRADAPTAKLSGLWVDVDFDVDDADVRDLRQRVTQRLAEKV